MAEQDDHLSTSKHLARVSRAMSMSDEKHDLCMSFILDQMAAKESRSEDVTAEPFFLGVNGVQGIGKTSLVSSIARALGEFPHSIPTVVISIDDFYLSHEDQSRLAADHPNNPLIQHRGQPSTHDLNLATSVLSSLRAGRKSRIPSYDKSAFNGQGDRIPDSEWTMVNESVDRPAKLVILEGWCLGFRSLDPSWLKAYWEKAVRTCVESNDYHGRLGHTRFENVQFLNEALKDYDAITEARKTARADEISDAEDPQYVYDWRLEQEANLRRERGSGMTDEEVVAFVNGCQFAPHEFLLLN
ncbi:MAG: hypothetical protein Q9183_001580 [Haloplaca sp. 2 TL-2023]